MDIEAQVMSLVAEMDSSARDRVVAYLHARYQADSVEGTKAARKETAAHVARVTEAADDAIPVSKAAKITKVHEARLYAWIKRGKLKAAPGPIVRGRPALLVSVADIRAQL